jgi:hypothetical protein
MSEIKFTPEEVLEQLNKSWDENRYWVGTNHERYFNRGFMASAEIFKPQRDELYEALKALFEAREDEEFIAAREQAEQALKKATL